MRDARGAVLAEIEFLARSSHRVDALLAIAERPHDRSDLRELTGASSSTVSRLVREFEKRRWIVRNGHRYEATELGRFVAAGMEDLLDRVDTERKLRDCWEGLPTGTEGFTVEMASDATVTKATRETPYRPVKRFASLLEETGRFRFVGTDLALLEPIKDEFRERILDGMDAEIIDPPAVAKYVLSTYPDHCAAPLESANLSVLVHDELPSYGIGLFDRRICVSCYGPLDGTVKSLVDTDTPEAREWAESTYASYRREARPFALEAVAD